MPDKNEDITSRLVSWKGERRRSREKKREKRKEHKLRQCPTPWNQAKHKLGMQSIVRQVRASLFGKRREKEYKVKMERRRRKKEKEVS